jgi:hypothetical protein
VTEYQVVSRRCGGCGHVSEVCLQRRRAIWVAGAQKVVPDLDAALHRVQAYSLPRK